MLCLLQAADILRLAGIGRNEYIATMNKGKAKKLMWRLNASSILRDILPTEPVDVQFQGWWAVHVVNLGSPSAVSPSKALIREQNSTQTVQILSWQEHS